MAPSPELGGQPKAPDKAGADQQPSTPTTTATATEHSSSSTSSAPSPSSSSSNSNNPSQSSSSGTKHSPPTVVAAAAAAAVTSNSGSSSVGGNNNSSSSTSSGGVSAGAAGAVAGTLSAQATTPQQDSSKIDNMEESDLKALLEEAITYKRPKDREHKSATFNELLSKTEKEDQEQNFPFTSRAVQTKRASGRPTQGGSLQDLPEASLQEYYYSEFPFTADYGNRIGTFSQNWRRHQGGSSGAASVGPGGGDRATNPRQKRTTSSVSSRQREGGSLPSNVNVECSFFNDVGHHHTTGTITKFKKREGGSKSDYGTMVLTAPLITSAGAAELISAVAEVAGSTGLKNTESQLIDGCGTGVGSGHTVIDMGELESDETQSLLAHDALQQTLYDSGLDDYDGSGGDLYGSSTTTSGGSSTTGVGGGGGAGSGCSAMKKIPRYPAASYTSHVNLEIGEPSSTVRPSSVHHVDKTVSLPLLESNKSVDITSIQLGTTYPAVKCFVSSDNSKSDQTRVMMSSSNTKYIATQSIGQMISQQKCLDENGNSVQQFGSSLGSSSSAAGSAVGVGASGLVGSGGNSSSSVGGSGGGGAGNAGSKKRKPKSDRNTVLVIPEKIAGYRGKDYDIESLVCYIENKDKQKDGGKAGGSGASGSNPKNGTVMKVSGSASVENGIPEEKVPKKKNEKKKEKGKLKKSNSLEELSSCSRKKQQAEEEQNTHKNHVVDQQSGPAQKSQDAESAVTLRGGKGNKKAQNSNVGSSIASSVSSASSTASSHSSKEPSLTSGGKRGERRSWGTEELSYLEDSHNQIAQIVEKAEEKPAKKDSRKEAKESAEAVTPTFNAGKKRDSLRMSVESLSAISGAGVGSETAEFHVVTKKKKMKKKAHSLFAEDTTSSSATGGYSNVASNANNRRHLTVSQSYNLGSSTTVRTSNISGKYQASNSFTNDRDVYMNSNDVSRRKSTSSVPPSEKSDSSDADSVQSLPIEPSRKQQQQQHQSHQSGASRHPSAGVPQSYADIARIPNADRINNNIIGATTSNSSTSPLNSSSVEKWPPVQATTNEDLAQALKSPSAFPELVPESSSQQPQQQQTVQSPNQPQQQQQQQYQQQHQYVNSSVSSVNNLGNSNKATYSQSLLIATTKATAVEEDDFASRLQQQQRLAAASSGKLVSSVNNSEHSVNISSINNSSSSSSSSKLALHKSKSVDTNDIYYSNEEHYPALEKTVKPAVKMAAAPTVTANSNSLLNEPKTTSSITGGKVSPVGAIAGQSQPTTTNAPATTVTTTVISGNPIASNVSTAGAKKSKKKDSVINSVTTDPSIPANDVESINNARNVASSLDLVNNNPLLIENIDMDFPQNGMLNRSPNGGGQQPSLQSTPKNSSASSIPSSAALSKRSKKDKATMISQNSIANAAPTVTANSNHRPAVIIMNDHHNESGTSHEFTFGFDIDQELLFGDFQEDEVTSMLDQHHQYHHQQKTSPQHHNSTENVPSPTSAISNTSTDLGYSSMQQSSSSTTTASTGSPTSSNNSSLSSSHTTQPNKPPQQYHHHHHHQQYHNQAPTQPPQMEAAYDSVLHSSADPDTYRDGIEHKFHQPPPPMVPAMYTQPPPQLPPPHVLAAQQQQQQSARQPRTAGPNHYNLPPPPVVIPSHIQQQPPPALPVVAAKQDTATNTPAIMSVPPPPLPPVVVPAAPIAVILPAGPPPVATSSSSSNTNPAAVTAAAGVISSSSNNSSSSNIHTSLNNQTMASSSGSSSSINSCSSVSLQQEPKPQRQPAAVQPQQQQPQQQMQNSAQPPIREKIKEINLRFIAPDQLQTSHNHDKIVNFVGMAWEDVICGTNGSAKYYEGQ